MLIRLIILITVGRDGSLPVEKRLDEYEQRA